MRLLTFASRSVFVVTCLLSGSLPAAEITADQVQERYTRAKQTVRNGSQAAALKELIWLFDEGMPAVPSFKGVRTSFLLSTFKELAQFYRPARDAMVARWIEAEARLLAGDAQAANEFAGWSDALGETKRMMAIFDQLPANDPRRRGFGTRAFRVLFPQRRYADALTAMPPDSMLRLADATLNRTSISARAAESSLRYSVNSMLDYIETLAGGNEMTAANLMAHKLRALDPGASTDRAIEARIKRGQELASP